MRSGYEDREACYAALAHSFGVYISPKSHREATQPKVDEREEGLA